MIQQREADASVEAVDRDPSCETCGSYLWWVDCWDCGGEGYHDDLYEQDPLWYDPDDIELCETCWGKKGHYVCRVCCPQGLKE